MLDEIEELELVLDHYAVTWGVKLFNPAIEADARAHWTSWGLKPSAGEPGEVED